jgi:hypothetical protein
MSLKEFTKELNGSRVEGELIKTVLYSLLTSFVILGIAFYFRLRYMDGFMAKYGFYLFFAALSYALIVPSVRQVRAYKNFACMSGMMIGMTVGMIAGFLSGYIIGATNGMFAGGVFGMVVGIVLGIWLGSCCGVMGLMEGIMAGLMGGWMGAMTSVMLINDHLRLATVLIFIVCAVILIALNYMIYLESKNRSRERDEDHFITFFITFLLIIITVGLMMFGPRGLI